jgi:ribonucrease Y
LDALTYIIIAIVAVLAGLAGVFVAWRACTKCSRVESETAKLQSADQERVAERVRVLETERRELQVAAKEELLQLRNRLEEESKSSRAEVDKARKRLEEREDNLDKRKNQVEEQARQLRKRDEELTRKQAEIDKAAARIREEVERVAQMTTEEARKVLLSEVEEDIRQEAAQLIRRVEAEAREEGERKAAGIVSQAIQRCAVEQTTETTVSVVALPSDEMKGRIIGREGRNIRAFEQLTGIDLIVDDTPEAVVLSGFDPVRREIAKVALEQLVTDGRIHPGRIEETIEKARRTVEERMKEAAEAATFEAGVTGLHPELLRMLGKLRFRTSYGQNVLKHSVEVSHLAGAMAGELGSKVAVARRAGLLHDIGKAVDFEREGSHSDIGAEVARSKGESPEIVHAIESHHDDMNINTVEAALVQAADAISASRPGARRETLETYLKRLGGLEEIARSFEGVDKVYAIQAGREVRVLVRPERIDDLSAYKLAKSMAERIESELDYPGQIRVTVVRETRAVEYAK